MQYQSSVSPEVIAKLPTFRDMVFGLDRIALDMLERGEQTISEERAFLLYLEYREDAESTAEMAAQEAGHDNRFFHLEKYMDADSATPEQVAAAYVRAACDWFQGQIIHSAMTGEPLYGLVWD